MSGERRRRGRVRGKGYYPKRLFTEQIHIYVTPEEKKIAEELAARRGISISELMRGLLIREHRQVMKRGEQRRAEKAVSAASPKGEVELGFPVEIEAEVEEGGEGVQLGLEVDFLLNNPWLRVIAGRGDEG